MSRVTKLAPILIAADVAALAEPAGEVGADLSPIRDGGYAPSGGMVVVRKITGAGDVTVAGLELRIYMNGAWHQAGALNGGANVVVSTGTAWSETVLRAGLAERVSVRAASVTGGTVTVEYVPFEELDRP